MSSSTHVRVSARGCVGVVPTTEVPVAVDAVRLAVVALLRDRAGCS